MYFIYLKRQKFWNMNAKHSTSMLRWLNTICYTYSQALTLVNKVNTILNKNLKKKVKDIN